MIVTTLTTLRYRCLEPGDEAALWLACKYRTPNRPSYAASVNLVSEQLEADEGVSDYLAFQANAKRCLLALVGSRPVGLLTVELPSTLAGVATVHVDPKDLEFAAEMEADAWQWAELYGTANIELAVYAGEPDEPLGTRPLIFSQ